MRKFFIAGLLALLTVPVAAQQSATLQPGQRIEIQAAPVKPETVTVTLVDSLYCSKSPCPPNVWTKTPPSGGGQAPMVTQIFGPDDLHRAPTASPFGWTSMSTGTPKALFSNLQWAAKNRVRIRLNLPGGGHSAVGPNLSIIDGKLRYDEAKWMARVRAFDTKAVRDSVAKYREWIESINAYDEPHVTGGDDGAGTVQKNTWGERGWMTKEKVDRGCAEIKRVFPGIPVGVAHGPTLFEPTKKYKVCDFIIAQWSVRQKPGDRLKWYEEAVRLTEAEGTQLALSINIVNGGVQDREGAWDCASPAQGGLRGGRQPNCAMHPDTVKAALLFLGSRGHGGMMMWQWEDGPLMQRLAPVFKVVADSLSKVPYKPLKVR